MEDKSKTFSTKETRFGKTVFYHLTCHYGTAILHRIREDGDVTCMDIEGKTMDGIVKAWQEYRASQKEEI